MKHRLFLITVVSISMLLSACAVDDRADCSNLPAGMTIRVENAWTRAVTSGSSAAYMVISNCGSQADKLVGARSNVSVQTSLHQTESVNGVMVMNAVSELEVPAGKKVELASGKYHIMMMDIQREIKPGDPVEIVLQFARVGEVKVSAFARAP